MASIYMPLPSFVSGTGSAPSSILSGEWKMALFGHEFVRNKRLLRYSRADLFHQRDPYWRPVATSRRARRYPET